MIEIKDKCPTHPPPPLPVAHAPGDSPDGAAYASKHKPRTRLWPPWRVSEDGSQRSSLRTTLAVLTVAALLCTVAWKSSRKPVDMTTMAGRAAAASGVVPRSPPPPLARSLPPPRFGIATPPPRHPLLTDDDTVRCRVGGVCEGARACVQSGDTPSSDPLGCVTTAPARRAAVVAAIRHAWAGYTASAWGHDELRPLSNSSSTWFNMGLTLTDSLDTLLLAGLDREYRAAVAWVTTPQGVDGEGDGHARGKGGLALASGKDVNVFETTIRVLGGLLAAAHLEPVLLTPRRGRAGSGTASTTALGRRGGGATTPRANTGASTPLLAAAAQLGLRLLPGYEGWTGARLTPGGFPLSDVHTTTLDAAAPAWTGAASLSEATTLAMETSYLGRATGEDAPANASLAALKRAVELTTAHGVDGALAPIYVSTDGTHFSGATITLGARGDSYYEYLLKQWVLGGRVEAWLKDAYVDSMRGVRARLLRRTPPSARHPAGLAYIGELVNGAFSPKMDHLVCFLPGLLALGAANGVDTRRSDVPSDAPDAALAADLAATCAELYRCVPGGLAPEIAHFVVEDRAPVVPGVEGKHEHASSSSSSDPGHPKKHAADAGCAAFDVSPADGHNLLRPEAVESWFILWRLTRDPAYREWGWAAFRAWEKYSKVPWGGYANLETVMSVPPPQRDKMESFFVAETLKYLVLMFEDEGAER